MVSIIRGKIDAVRKRGVLGRMVRLHVAGLTASLNGDIYIKRRFLNTKLNEILSDSDGSSKSLLTAKSKLTAIEKQINEIRNIREKKRAEKSDMLGYLESEKNKLQKQIKTLEKESNIDIQKLKGKSIHLSIGSV